MTKDTFRVLSPTAILGYGFPAESFERGIEACPDLIAVDGGSSDPGPYYLGAGKPFVSRPGVKRDLDLILSAASSRSLQVIIGTAGGSGAHPHVEWAFDIIKEVARERGLRLRVAVVSADIPREHVLQALNEGQISELVPGVGLDAEKIGQTTHIVAQMGVEPVLRAMADADVVLCGRAYDPVPFAAPAIAEGFNPGLALHMGKILECAAIAATPGSGRDCVVGTLHGDHFTLESMNPSREFTPLSAAAHTLYEKSDPETLPGPGGDLDLRQASFVDEGQGRVRVSGSVHRSSPVYRVKLEGARRVGFRTASIAGIRDPYFIQEIDDVLATLPSELRSATDVDGQIHFHVYGRDGVMGDLEPLAHDRGHELGLIIEAVAATQDEADALCSLARSTLLHLSYPNRIATAGNLAVLFSPSDLSCGEVYEFSIYHLLDVDDPVSLFPVEIREVG